ncbi:pyridine nucleotide-disulfide oxidoreductase [Gordonia amicalis]|uniref:pyridine nucleotide-disulfide oxidoreductase n=1 Tax=Gordonia amicalis TaxID=89053 RepID=UPI0015F39673|nr:pyridine nucleotide-disulfide oxidoreductase [Gordonia amicalis]MBA5848437.1 pyridine nucleotide-disulfide oxidoreductase [Gordonia amicalis]UKO92103.1 pyridine nucleotide-disulfide oxidoreductase [Gordonia amicalis]
MSRPQNIQSDTDQLETEEIGPLPGPRRPLWQIGRRATVIVACLGFSALAACSFSVGTQTVEEASDIDVGECLQIGEEEGDGKVVATKEDCEGTEGLTFYAADKVSSGAECTADYTSSLTFSGGDEKLCMTPNFATDTCYQIPLNGGDLADYREVGCSTSPVETTIIAKTVSRGDGSITCPGDQTRWTFTQPASIGYCLTEDVTAAGEFGG